MTSPKNDKPAATPVTNGMSADTKRQIRRGLVISVLVGFAVMFIAMLALSYAHPAMRKLRNAPKPAEWTLRMERLGVILVYYSVRHEGKLPDKLSTLMKEGFANTLEQFHSPDLPNRITSASEIDANTDFLYLLPNGMITDTPQAALRKNVPEGRTLMISKKGLSWMD